MESLEDRSSAPDPEGNAPSPRNGKAGRVAAHVQGLLDDLRTWIDLRLDLALLKVEERIDELRNEIALGLTLAIFGLFAALFSLATVALGVGWLLGHPFWGFLAVSVALILIVVVLQVARPSLMPPSKFFQDLRGARGSESARDGRSSGAGEPESPDASSSQESRS
jgi:hypothetical protein